MIVLKKPDFDPKNITAGIAHIGVGNFHRAHLAYLTNLLLEDKSQQNWGICGIALLDSDKLLVENLRKQNCKYNLLVCPPNGKDEAFCINSIVDLLWAKQDKQAVVNKLASPDIKIISMTITEGGYNIDKESGQFNLENDLVKQDIENLDVQNIKSVFGYVAMALKIRSKLENGKGKVTILSCDNLQHNGNTAKKAFLCFIKAKDEALYKWAKENVSFPNSMVDRITPVVKQEDKEKINEKIGVFDNAPIYCEDFIQWVVEDNFINERPSWQNVGVEFTDDVSDYENMKLSLLNASHTLLSYPSFLAGYRNVDDAMHDEIIVKFVEDFMDIDITKFVPAPKNIDLEKYKKTLLERFANRTVSDQIARLCFDGASKFPVYIMPNLEKMLNSNSKLERLAFLFASYRKYLSFKKDDKGNVFEIAEPNLTKADLEIIKSKDEISFLKLSAFAKVKLYENENFVNLYNYFCKAIEKNDILSVLKTILS